MQGKVDLQTGITRIHKLSRLSGRHRASAVGIETAQLRILLSTLLGDMKQKATDRFVRDTIRGCYGAERFVLLHHTLHHGRPL